LSFGGGVLSFGGGVGVFNSGVSGGGVPGGYWGS
jgi:hypothetical protein